MADMDSKNVGKSIEAGALSLVLSLVLAYGASLAIPITVLQWALIAVGAASFFSGFFSSYYRFKG